MRCTQCVPLCLLGDPKVNRGRFTYLESRASFPKQPDDFAAFPSRVSSAGLQLFDQFKMWPKQVVELFPGHTKRRPTLLRRFARVPRIQKKYGQQTTGRPQCSADTFHVIRTLPRVDRTKAGVFKNPIEAISQPIRKI